MLRHTICWDVVFLVAQMLNAVDDELFDPFGDAEALMKLGGRVRSFGDVTLGCQVFLNVRALRGHWCLGVWEY